MKPILRGGKAPSVNQTSLAPKRSHLQAASSCLGHGALGSRTGPPGDAVDLSEPREIKIKLPIGIHVKLQSLKIAKGKQISKVVLEALEACFETVDQEKQHR